jgi:HK97 gp10 family phage protein
VPIRMRVKLEGAEQIARRLQILGKEAAREHLEASARSGAEVIRRAASDNARSGPYATGDLADHVVAEVTKARAGRVEVSVGPDRDHWYGRLVELGHALVRVVARVRKGGRVRRITENLGNVPPHPWLRPALDENTDEAQRVVGEELRRRLRL